MANQRLPKTTRPAPAARAKPASRRPAPGRDADAHRLGAALAKPQNVSSETSLQLQRLAGNRAVQRLLAKQDGAVEEPRPAASEPAVRVVMRRPEQPASAPTEAAPSTADELQQIGAEPASSRPAPAALQRQASVGPAGGEAGAVIEQRLASSRGAGAPLPADTQTRMETAIGADFSQVRVHTDAQSQALSQQLGAQAFTYGSDIYLAEGKYQPNSSGGQQLLAHELTHTVQQGASPLQRRPAPQAADPTAEADDTGLIRRKLAGVTDAVLAQGGAPSLKSQGKAKVAAIKSLVTGPVTDEGSGKYAQIISKLRDYEALEAKHLNLHQQFLTQAQKAELWGSLRELEQLVTGWLQQNAGAAIGRQQALRESGVDEYSQALANETPEQRRYHALTALVPRLRHEQMEINHDDFYRAEAWSDKRLNAAQTVNDRFGGNVNRLDQVAHTGNAPGVFIWDRRAAVETAGNRMGISMADPNAGARSVAMYQLAKLLDLGVNVIAKTEFATHTSDTDRFNKRTNERIPLEAPMAKMGVRQQMAGGREAAETPTAVTDQQAQQARLTNEGRDTVSLQDPNLQRSLNAIQLIDAIAGQLDRHWHNYYIATDGRGHVLGVIGIDLDMAFAPDHRTLAPATDNFGDPLKGAHFVGMPQLVDSQFAARIVAVPAESVRQLLTIYLSEAEVNAAVERYTIVQDACRGILQRHEAILPGGWGAATSGRQLAGGPNASYLGKMAAGLTSHTFAEPAQTVIRQRAGPEGSSHLSRLFKVVEALEPFIWGDRISVAQGMQMVQKIMDNYVAVPEQGLHRNNWVDRLKAVAPPAWNTVLDRPPIEANLIGRLA